MSDSDPTTRPTLETLLDMVREVRDEGRAFRDEMRAGFASVNERIDRVETKLEQVEIRQDKAETLLDRVTGAAFETRADMRDLKKEVREHFTATQ
jgi:hypothetical protein